jgi:glycosyltransferase involved in cell wall biosynthesis
MKGISVVICCYNSTSRLEQTLGFLGNQQTSTNVEWELIIVDNASTDDTGNVAKTIWNKVKQGVGKLTIVYEPIPGLTYARKKGADTARYDIIVYCDDDNWLSPYYVQSAFDLMQNNDIAIACGFGIAITHYTFPPWFTHVFPYYGCHSIEGYTTSGNEHQKLQYGAGMVVRKSLLIQINNSGYNYYLKGRNGSSLSSGEDTELMLLARILGYKVVNSDRLKFHHYIPDSRLSKHYLRRLIQGVCFNGLKLEPFKIYLENTKPLTNVTWLKDTIYVSKYFLLSCCRFLIKNSFEYKVEFLANWHALQCSFRNFNQYKEIGQRLDNLKATMKNS